MAEQPNATSLFLGFTCLGLLVGSIAGLSSAGLTLTLFGLLFAFAGGSIIAFLGNISRSSIGLAGVALSGFCLAALIALYLGIFIKVNDLLYIHPKQLVSERLATITAPRNESATTADKDNRYSGQDFRDLLRSADLQLENYLRDEVGSGQITLSAACERLNGSILDGGKSPK